MRAGTTFRKEGWGDQPRLKLYNATTLASIGTRGIPQMSYLCIGWRTSQNAVKSKFAEF